MAKKKKQQSFIKIESSKTLLDIRIDPTIDDLPPGGQIKVVRGTLTSGAVSYAIFVDNRYLGEFDAESEKDAVLNGLTRVRELLEYLASDEDTIPEGEESK